MIRRLITAPFVIALLIATGCGAGKDTGNNTGNDEPGSSRMADTLAAIYQEAQAEPMSYFHLNRLRSEVWGRRADEAAYPREERRARYFRALELLNAGQTEAAIDELESLLEEVQPDTSFIRPQGRELLDLLAMANLRLGEQQNCIDNHTGAACVLPMAEEALHRRQEGSKRALEIYELLFRHFPADLTARWLYNIAAITLDRYPHAVPRALLIPGLDHPSGAVIPRFENVAPALGIDVTGLSGGTAVDDFNGDGHLDVFATSYGLADPVRFFLGDGEGGFVDATTEAGLDGIVSGLNVVHADYDNDGALDIYVLRGAWLGDHGEHPNSLLRNNGDGTFTDVAFEAGVASDAPTQTASWADFNLDGWIDLAVGNESSSDYLAAWERSSSETENVKGGTYPLELYLNNGDGTFTDVAPRLGVDVEAFIKGVVWGDVDNDGYPDLFVSVLGGENKLFVNGGGTSMSDWTFDERASTAGVADFLFSFPSWFWDVDNDGWQDLFVGSYDLRRIDHAAEDVARELLGTHFESEIPRLYRNNGDGTFTDVTRSTGLDVTSFAMGTNFGDVDNDGYPDFYLGTGAPDLRSIIPNRFFLNDGRGRFVDRTMEAGLGHLQKGHAVAFADLDRDGDQDIYAVMGGAVEGDVFQNALFENPGPAPENAWISLHLRGTEANRAAVGARIRVDVVDADGGVRTIHKTVTTGGSFGSSPLEAHVGLGPAAALRSVSVTWPDRSRTTEEIPGLEVNAAYRIEQGSGRAERLPYGTGRFRLGKLPAAEGHPSISRGVDRSKPDSQQR